MGTHASSLLCWERISTALIAIPAAPIPTARGRAIVLGSRRDCGQGVRTRKWNNLEESGDKEAKHLTNRSSTAVGPSRGVALPREQGPS